METTWQVLIGLGIGSVLVAIYGLYKDYVKESREHNESQRLAKISLVLGLSGIVLVGLGNLAGLIAGVIAVRRQQYKALAKIGILVSILTFVPWLMVMVLGPDWVQ